MMKILHADQVPLSEILARTEDQRDISGIVAGIIAEVRKNGDAALRRYAKEFDHADIDALEIPGEQLDRALADLEPDLREVLEEAAENIRAFHQRQVQNGFTISEKSGVVLGQKVTPIEKVGVYIPGGTAPLPSTVLMDCIPAKIAGCSEIMMVSPPACGGDIAPIILAAARIAGVDRVFRCGGAQAVAALAQPLFGSFGFAGLAPVCCGVLLPVLQSAITAAFTFATALVMASFGSLDSSCAGTSIGDTSSDRTASSVSSGSSIFRSAMKRTISPRAIFAWVPFCFSFPSTSSAKTTVINRQECSA